MDDFSLPYIYIYTHTHTHIHQPLYLLHLFNCLVTQIANQRITWQQLNAFRHLDEVQTEHQNGEERGFK